MKYLIFFICLVSAARAQQIKVVSEKKGVSCRGLSVVTDKIIWVCGNNGTVGRSIDGGTTWNWMQIAGYETRDFRDIEAFDGHTALVMAVGEPGLILKTEDDGKRWKPVYMNDTPGIFLDAIEFWNNESGIVLGDPIKGRFFIARTFDGGNNWKSLSEDKLPSADSGEACFAASGTNVRALNRGEACFVSGGSTSRFFYRTNAVKLPLLSGNETESANSVAVRYKSRKLPTLVVVGGDFNKPSAVEKNCAISTDGGHSWSIPITPPNGYRSCVEFITGQRLIACGLTGVDLSDDNGLHWRLISNTGFHVCRRAKKGKAVYLAGSEKIGKLEL